jgi:hypothetical protein
MKRLYSLLPILTITMAVALPVAAQSFLTNDLVLFYPFNGNANDASGNGNNGTVQGATLTTNRFGAPNSAYAFDGVQSRIQFPETLFGPTNSAVTISAWVTTDNGSYSGNQTIFEKGSANGEMQIGLSGGQFSFGPDLSNPRGFVVASTPVVSNAVTQLVGVYEQGQGIWLYTNGFLANCVTNIPNSTLWQNTSGYPLVSSIGIYDYTPAPYYGFRGDIDDVRVYTRALSPSEVQQLYQYEATPPSSMLPTITSEPQDAYVYAYGSAAFSVGASGATTFQWLFNGSNILNATSSTLTLSNIVQSELGQYSALAGNSFGSVTSSAANLYMYPSIVSPFTGVVTDWGQSNTLSVTAWGSGTLAYQWYDNGAAIPDATNSTLTFSSIQFTNAGSYSVVISSSLGSVTNAPAQVVVDPAGVSLGLYPGITVTGTVGNAYDIQSNPDLSNPNGWTTVSTLTLYQPVEIWVDVNNNVLTTQHHFYRVIPAQ